MSLYTKKIPIQHGPMKKNIIQEKKACSGKVILDSAFPLLEL